MGIAAMDEFLVHQVFIQPHVKRRIYVPMIFHEATLFILSWLGLFFLEDDVSD
jgi:hypothetical protein